MKFRYLFFLDHAWNVITEFATELLETYNLDKEQVRKINKILKYEY